MPTKRRHLNIADILIPDVRVTAQYDEDQQQELADSLVEEGQLEDIKVINTGEQLLLVNGLNRIHELLARGESQVWALVQDGDEKDVLIQNLSTSYHRGKVRVSDEVKVIEELTNEHQMDSIDIARRTGMSQARIEQIQWAMTSCPEVRSALDEGLISLGHAAELARHLDKDQQAVLLTHLLANRWSLRILHEYIQGVLERQGELDQQAVSTSAINQQEQLATCYFCSEPWDPRRLSAVMCCPSCNGLMQDILRRQRDRNERVMAED